MSIMAMESLLSSPRIRLDDLDSAGQSLCFIIDQSRQPEALERLYGLGHPLDQQNLFLRTEFAALADKGPIWISAPETAELKALAAELCQQRNAGICLLTRDVQQALKHARWLLKANDGSGGQSLLSYYRPSLWAALMTAAERPSAHLLGPWTSVFSSAPRHFGEGNGDWIAWPANQEPLGPTAYAMHFNLPPATVARQRRFGWLYWLDEEYAAFGSPETQSLPCIIDNLELLTQHRIYQARHLRELAALLTGPPLEDRPDVMAILVSDQLAYQKTDQLKKLTAAAPLREQDNWNHHGTR